MKYNEYGRSMVEMLGVLAIIGIISVGGLNILTQSFNRQKINQLLIDISNSARATKGISCQWDKGYQGKFTQFVYNNKSYPDDWTYDKTQKEFTGPLNVKISYKSAETEDSGYVSLENFTIILKNYPEEACMEIATTNWGTTGNSGFIGMTLGGTVYADKDDVGLDALASACESNALGSIELTYKACN